MHTLTVYGVVLTIIYIDAHVIPDSYAKQRNALLDEETHTAVGGKIHLTEDELLANEIVMKWKHKELDDSLKNPQYFNFSKHYFTYKEDIVKSNVYQIIRSMPKGAVLHVHSSLMLDPSVLVKLTYMEHLYACFADEGLSLQFSESIPARPCKTNWALISDLRKLSANALMFDEELKSYFTLYKDDDEDFSKVDINTVWKRFDKVYQAIKTLIKYRPAREKYWYETLKQFYEDNVMYIEVRTGLSSIYELDGSKHPKKYMVELYQRVTNAFMDEYPEFVGIKLIVTRHRAQSVDQVLESLNLTRKLKSEIPEMIAGFDLVGQEDLGRPLTDFIPILSEAKKDIDYYLHAGETAWLGTSTDENLVDAILLGSKRIGHGYALTKHPTLLDVVIKRNIALEVNVISNVVLSLVTDVRNHPLASYLAMGLPVVLSSDDPGAWSSKPLSEDFFVAFMGVASKRADLRLLKQLALNSIIYSALDERGKIKLLKIFEKQWLHFIREVISNETLIWESYV